MLLQMIMLIVTHWSLWLQGNSEYEAVSSAVDLPLPLTANALKDANGI